MHRSTSISNLTTQRAAGRWLLLALFAAGCSSNRAQEGPQVGPGAVERSIAVENGTSVDLRIAVVTGPRRLMIGTVRARGNRTMALPRGTTGSFQLMAEPTGGGGMTSRLFSEPIQISNADRATWEIRSTGSSAVGPAPASGQHDRRDLPRREIERTFDGRDRAAAQIDEPAACRRARRHPQPGLWPAIRPARRLRQCCCRW